MMKYIMMLLGILLFSTTNITADTLPQLFTESGSEFHKLDINTLQEDKTNDLCINCHLLNAEESLPKWLTPQKSIFGTILNLDDKNGEPDPFSKACLMCHDGSAASLVLNAPISPCGLRSAASVSMNGANHPVFMKYVQKQDLNEPSSVLRGVWKDANVVSDLLRDEKVVCISCHIPHHTKNEGFVRTSTKGSGLCLGCHIK